MKDLIEKAEKRNRILDIYVGGGAGIIGLCLLVYGIWLQTDGFKVQEWGERLVDPAYLLVALLIGAALGVLMIYNLKKNDAEMKHVKGIAVGYVFCLTLCAILVFRARTVIAFLLGTGGMLTSLILLIYVAAAKLRLEKKKAEAEGKRP